MPVDVAADPSLTNAARQMSKLMEQMQRGYSNFAPSETWQPSVNLYETDGGYLVCVDLAGVEKQKIDITVQEGSLRLRGHRVVPNHSQAEDNAFTRCTRVHLMEIDHGAFSREVELPNDVHKATISAHYTDGLLWIELPKNN